MMRRRDVAMLRAAEVAAIAAIILATDYVHFYVVGRSYISEYVLTANLPLKLAGIEPLFHGSLPTWSPRLGAGWPVLADGASMPLDWRNIFFLLFDAFPAYWAALFVSRLIGASFLFYYLRIRHDMRFAAALPATFVYFCGDMMMEDSRFAGAACWDLLPAYLWAVEALYERATARRGAVLAALWFFMFTMGSFGVMINIAPEGALWALALFLASRARDWWRFARFTGAFLAAHALGIAMTAVTLIPFTEFVLNSSRGDEYDTDPFALRGIFFSLFGAHDPYLPLFPPFNFFLYVGVTTLPFIFSTWERRSDTYTRALFWLSIAVLLFLVILTTPVKIVLIDLVPSVAAISAIRFAAFWGFLAAVAAGIALNRREWVPSRRVRMATAALLVIQSIPVAAIAFVGMLWIVVSTEYPDKAPAVLGELRPFLMPSFLTLVGIRLLGLVMACRLIPTPIPALAAIVLVEMSTAMAIARSSTVPVQYRVTPEVAYLKEHLDDNARMMVVYPFFARELDAYLTLLFDAPAVQGLNSANIYDSLVVRAYADTFADFGDVDERKALYRRAYNSALVTNRANSPLMDALAVRFVVAATPPVDTTRLIERLKGENYIVYERVDAMPRAFFVSDAEVLEQNEIHDRLRQIARAEFTTQQLRRYVMLDKDTTPAEIATKKGAERFAPAHVAEDAYSRIRIDLDAPSDGWLVLSDAYYPGWRATANGSSVPIMRANGFARAVPVRSGHQEVVFQFEPRGAIYGAWISGAAIVMTILLCVVSRRRF